MRRYAVPIVIVGSMALLGALLLLWKAIATDAPAPEVSVGPRSPEPGAAAPAGTAPPRGPTARAPLPLVPRRGGESAAPAPHDPASPPPTLAQDDGPPGTMLNTKNLHFGVPQMRALIDATGPQVRECLRAAGGASGEATLTFIVAKRGERYVVEDTGVDDDATTLQGEGLLECLHATSRALVFQGLPREATAVIVTRRVSADKGNLVDNEMLKFSYIH
jgi:hypothetical protein